jgi:hypothetical protein
MLTGYPIRESVPEVLYLSGPELPVGVLLTVENSRNSRILQKKARIRKMKCGL